MLKRSLSILNDILVFTLIVSIFNDGFLVEHFGENILKIIFILFLIFNVKVILKNIKSMYLSQDKMFFLFFIFLLISFMIRSLIEMPDDLIKPTFTLISVIVIVTYFSRYPLNKVLYFIWAAMMISIIICYFNEPIVEWTFRKSGGTIDPNKFAAGLMPFMLTAVYLYTINKSRLFLLISILFFLYGIFNSGSKTAFLVLGIISTLTLLKYLIFNFKSIFNYKLILLLSVMLIAAMQIDFYKIEAVSNILGRTKDMGTAEQRFISWKAGQHMIEEHPLLGVGLSEFGKYTHKYAETKIRATSAHNSYIQLLAESGIFVFILFMGFLFILLIKNFNIIIHSDIFWIYLSLISILLTGMALGTMYYKFQWLYIAILMNIHYLIVNRKLI